MARQIIRITLILSNLTMRFSASVASVASFAAFVFIFTTCTSVTLSNGNNAILSKPPTHYIPACVTTCTDGNYLPYKNMCIHGCTLDAIRPDGLNAWFTYFVRALLFSALYSYTMSESLLALHPTFCHVLRAYKNTVLKQSNGWIGRNPARNTLKVMIGIGALGLVILLMDGISVQKKLLAPFFPATWTTRPYAIYTTVGMGMPSGHAELLLYSRWLLLKVVQLVDPFNARIDARIDACIVLILWSTLWWEFHYISQCFIGLVVAALLINLVRNVSVRVSSHITPE